MLANQPNPSSSNTSGAGKHIITNGSKKTLHSGKKLGTNGSGYPASGKMVLSTNLGGKKPSTNGGVIYEDDMMIEGDEGLNDGQCSQYEESSEAPFNGRGVL
jgi:hypothetical protein